MSCCVTGDLEPFAPLLAAQSVLCHASTSAGGHVVVANQKSIKAFRMRTRAHCGNTMRRRHQQRMSSGLGLGEVILSRQQPTKLEPSLWFSLTSSVTFTQKRHEKLTLLSREDQRVSCGCMFLDVLGSGTTAAQSGGMPLRPGLVRVYWLTVCASPTWHGQFSTWSCGRCTSPNRWS